MNSNSSQQKVLNTEAKNKFVEWWNRWNPMKSFHEIDGIPWDTVKSHESRNCHWWFGIDSIGHFPSRSARQIFSSNRTNTEISLAPEVLRNKKPWQNEVVFFFWGGGALSFKSCAIIVRNRIRLNLNNICLLHIYNIIYWLYDYFCVWICFSSFLWLCIQLIQLTICRRWRTCNISQSNKRRIRVIKNLSRSRW